PRDGGEGSLCIMLSDDASLRRLNRTWRGKDRPTNVLSFPAEAPGPRGDVALALGVLIRESAAQGKPRRDHLAHLVVHGVLHLLGHDHVRNADAGRMERLERKILARLGVPDPYRRRGAPIVL
ncbi:MAG TPA: rRNA maturation RNase YbeY, partial [Candidatus Cybelea sp.]|nr:rRNA maturation RNase YbeY [Candidatus Cybelea sp.]